MYMLTKTLLFKKSWSIYNARARIINISQKKILAKNKLFKIKKVDKYNMGKIKHMTVSWKKHMIILVYWLDLYYITLEIKSMLII